MDAFDVIFTTYSPIVFRYLRSLSGDAAVAEELTAETFYRAYTHFDSFRGDSKLETWLCAIAKNAYLKDCRRSARTLGELSFRDIADIFGKSESLAKVTYFRAKNKIIERMEGST